MNAEQALDAVSTYMVEHDESLAVAERSTFGRLLAIFEHAEQAEFFVQGGITAFHPAQMTRHLDVDPIAAETAGGVSEKIAITMAVSVSKLFCCDWGIAVTGFTEPDPQRELDHKLYAYYAISYQGICRKSGRIEALKDSPGMLEQLYAEQTLINLAALFYEQS